MPSSPVSQLTAQVVTLFESFGAGAEHVGPKVAELLGLPYIGQGHSTAEKADENTKKHKAAPTAVLLDESGTMGQAYGAKTTPHMFVINPEGNLIYNGAIDDKESTDVADIEGAHNYVLAALEQSKKGEAVATPTSKPYGCAVKY